MSLREVLLRPCESASARVRSQSLLPQADLSFEPSFHFDSTVYLKLAIFSLSMFILPLTTYFATVSRMGTAWAGGLAALSANVVLIGYIIAAFLEDGEAGGEDRDQVFKATQPTGTKKEGKDK